MPELMWINASEVDSESFLCGHCSINVASASGYYSVFRNRTQEKVYFIRICPHCERPTFFGHETTFPPSIPGQEVGHLPEHVETLFNEIRGCVGAGYHTSAVLSCRKLLAHIAVEQGADQGLKFIEYVEFLGSHGYVPPHGKHWVDHIRRKGNEATHEIVLMGHEDAEQLMIFVEMLLKFIYEFPNSIPAPVTPPASSMNAPN